MSIDADDYDDRQTRVDRMIDEFRKAQSRRVAKASALNGDDQGVESQRDADTQAAAVAGPTTTPTSH